MKRILVLLLVAMTTSLQGFAIVRSQQVMKEIATRQLQQMGINGMVTLATETNTYAIYRSAKAEVALEKHRKSDIADCEYSQNDCRGNPDFLFHFLFPFLLS